MLSHVLSSANTVAEVLPPCKGHDGLGCWFGRVWGGTGASGAGWEFSAGNREQSRAGKGSTKQVIVGGDKRYTGGYLWKLDRLKFFVEKKPQRQRL